MDKLFEDFCGSKYWVKNFELFSTHFVTLIKPIIGLEPDLEFGNSRFDLLFSRNSIGLDALSFLMDI
jgi:hypothetical protein